MNVKKKQQESIKSDCVCVCVCVCVEHSEIKLPNLHLTNRISKLLLQQKPNHRQERYRHYPTTMKGAVLKSLLSKLVKTSSSDTD